MERVFGFEILPAPFVVAHLQLGIFLQKHGTVFSEEHHERAAVYLTNSLTGWKPPEGVKEKLLFPEMEQERDAADRIKQSVPILVVLGNPPYNGFAGLPADEEAGLVEPYRTTKKAPKPQGQGLNDLYVRFFRVAERCITERGVSHGVVCYISNYSWLDGLSHTGMRERFLEEFDDIWIDSLNGDKYKTGKTTPDGRPDPSVFSTPQNREGIQVGTAIALLSRKPQHRKGSTIRFRDFWGEKKREDVLASLDEKRRGEKVKPLVDLGLPFRSLTIDDEYTTWPLLEHLFPQSYPGVKTSRDEDLVAYSHNELEERIGAYFDPQISHSQLEHVCPRLVKDASRFDASETRKTLLRQGISIGQFVKYDYRPFDRRWLYWVPETKLLDEKRPELFELVVPGNYFLFTTGRTRKDQIEPATMSSVLTDLNLMDSGARAFPLLNRISNEDLFQEPTEDGLAPNLSTSANRYLDELGVLTDSLFFHVLAVLHSDEYRTNNFAGLKSDWPRVPLPAGRDRLVASAELGRRIAALLDPEARVDGVTAGAIAPELRALGVPTKVGGGNFTDDDYAVTANWGYAGQNGVTMPAKGKVVSRKLDDEERSSLGPAVEVLGDDTCDIYLNDSAYWKNVPLPVWRYSLGGYQVLKKWLSYRELELLGRPLSVDEVAYIRDVVRRIASLLLLGPELDANYAAAKASTWPWPSPEPT